MTAPTFPQRDEDVATFVEALGLPGMIDMHVHVLPERLQAAVWRFFDRLEDPEWPIAYRDDAETRLGQLRALGVRLHTALAYAHKPGMAAGLNAFTLGVSERSPQVIPTFTFFPEPSAPDDVETALARGGQVVKVHLQVGRFHATDPRLDEVWPQLETAQTPVVIHASAVYGVDGGDEFCGADEIAALLDTHPDLRLVIAHLGAPDAADFLRLAELTPGLVMDTAMALTDPPYLAEYPTELLGRLAALADRLVLGSDFPSIPHAYAAQIRGLERLDLDAVALRGVLHDNALRLLDATRPGS